MIRAIIRILFAVAFAHFGAVSGILFFSTAFALVAGNALLSQGEPHKSPLWKTRTAQEEKAEAKAEAVEPLREIIQPPASPDEAAPLPQGRESQTAKTNDSPSPSPSGTQPDMLVAEIQSGLAELGLYRGKADGLNGPKTRFAIEEFQKREGVKIDGKPDQEIAERIAVRLDGGNDSLASSSSGIALPASAREKMDGKIVRLAQLGLVEYGDPDVAVDGALGDETKAALRKFQESYGLAVTGKPDLELIRKMKSIGLLKGG